MSQQLFLRKSLEIVKILSRKRISVFCGSAVDVLDRYYQAARLFNIEHIVRITADCPVVDPAVIDKVVGRYFRSKADYCTNALSETFPDGLDVEVFSFGVLETTWRKAKLPSEREHVTPYMRKNKRLFKIVSCKSRKNLGHHRWTIDEKSDYEFLQKLYQNLYKKKPFFGMEEIIHFLAKHPKVESINRGIMRNEGYMKSLKQDKPAR